MKTEVEFKFKIEVLGLSVQVSGSLTISVSPPPTDEPVMQGEPTSPPDERVTPEDEPKPPTDEQVTSQDDQSPQDDTAPQDETPPTDAPTVLSLEVSHADSPAPRIEVERAVRCSPEFFKRICADKKRFKDSMARWPEPKPHRGLYTYEEVQEMRARVKAATRARAEELMADLPRPAREAYFARRAETEKKVEELMANLLGALASGGSHE
jgi:hypothetical protein